MRVLTVAVLAGLLLFVAACLRRRALWWALALTACKGREVTLEKPFEVQPDPTSTVSWCAYQGRCLFIDNDFTDAGIALPSEYRHRPPSE